MMKRDGISDGNLEGVTMPICEKLVNHEASGDITLPEYLPEIRKLLNVNGKIQPPSKYVNGSAVECNGVIDYKLLFLGTDGNVYSTSFSSEYEFKAPIDDASECELSEGVVTLVGTSVDGIVSRVSSPKKVNVKCRLVSRVRCFAKMNLTEELVGEIEEESIERLDRECENAEMLSVTSDPIEINEEIVGLGDDIRVIGADASAFASDIKRSQGMVEVGGDLYLKLIYCKDGERPQTVSKKTRFSAEMETDTDVGDYLCRVVPTVTDIVVNVEESKVNCTVSLVVNAAVAYNKTVRYTEDAYSTERECECRSDRYAVPYVVVCANSNFSQSERIPIAETNIPPEASLIDSWGSACLPTCEIEDGRYVFAGQSKYWILWEKEGECGVCELTMPIRYECEGTENPESYDAVADVISIRTRLDGDTLSVDSEIAVAYDVIGSEQISTVRECRFGEKLEKKRKGMIVYYPATNESNWEVAKKYHVEADGLIAEKNYYLF